MKQELEHQELEIEGIKLTNLSGRVKLLHCFHYYVAWHRNYSEPPA